MYAVIQEFSWSELFSNKANFNFSLSKKHCQSLKQRKNQSWTGLNIFKAREILNGNINRVMYVTYEFHQRYTLYFRQPNFSCMFRELSKVKTYTLIKS